ncbi:MAG: hypothetical protein JRJ87_26305 [Deltaproteobacteria bacterium]|nr:hypothetical protein [Deltaproteobacteria bacterium]
MRTTVFSRLAVAMLLILAWCMQAQAAEPVKAKKNPNIWIESFPNPFRGWQDRFFYKHTDAEGYYVLCGHKPDYRPSDQEGLWIGVRGKDPLDSKMTLSIKPALGLEATYFSLGVNSHLARLNITFIDKNGKTIAVSCTPRTGYYKYIPVAVKIKNGLKAIHFDGHGTQVSGNVNINHVEVIFGKVPKDRDFVIHETQKNQCKVIPTKAKK